MKTRNAPVSAALALVLVAACGSDEPAAPTTTSPATATAEPADPTVDFPTRVFASMSDDPVSDELAAELQTALARQDVTSGGGMSARSLVGAAGSAWLPEAPISGAVRTLGDVNLALDRATSIELGLRRSGGLDSATCRLRPSPLVRSRREVVPALRRR